MLFFEGNVEVVLLKYSVTKETSCGWWIGGNDWLKYKASDFCAYSPKKWISKTARKRFAYPTKEEALVNFKARKQRQIGIVEDQLERAKEALVIIENPHWLEKNNHDYP